MKKILLTFLLVLSVMSCKTEQQKQPEKQTADVVIKKPDGSTVEMTYNEFVKIKELADRYEGIQKSLPDIQKNTKIERVKPHLYKLTIVLDDSTKITVMLDTNSK